MTRKNVIKLKTKTGLFGHSIKTVIWLLARYRVRDDQLKIIEDGDQ